MIEEDISCVFQGLSNIGNIFLSNHLATKDTFLIQSFGIQAILTIAQDRIQEKTIQILSNYSHLKLQKDKNYKISLLFDESFQFIEQTRKKTNILIHCQTGNNQSAVIVIAYLIKKYPYLVNNVYGFLKRKRALIQISNNYIKELNNFAAMLNPQDPGIKQGKGGKKLCSRVTTGNYKKNISLKNNIHKQVSLMMHKMPISELKREDSESPQKYIQNSSGLRKLSDQIKQLAEIHKLDKQIKQSNQQFASYLSQDQIKNDVNKETQDFFLIKTLQCKKSLQIQNIEQQEQTQQLPEEFLNFFRKQTKHKTLFEPEKPYLNSKSTKVTSMKLIQKQSDAIAPKAFQQKDLNQESDSSSFNSNQPQFFSKQIVVTEKQISQKQFGRSRSQSSVMKSALKKRSSINNPSQSKKTVKFSAHHIVHDFNEISEKRRPSITQIIQKNQQKKKFLSFKPDKKGFGGIALR